MSAVLKSGSRQWVIGGMVLLAALFAVDRLTAATVPPSVFAVAALVAAVGGSERSTAAVALLATALATTAVALRPGPLDRMDAIRLVTVFVIGMIGVVFAALRVRLERRGEELDEANRRAQETIALLDVIFAGTPAGLAFQDLEGRFVRVNDRLAEINGVPAAEHLGRTVSEVLPALPDVGAAIREVAQTGEAQTEMEMSGETPAQPGVRREWIASYWPVRASDGGKLLGVGTAVFEVTERRAAERALRTQTDRYETLLTALSEVGEGMVVLEENRCVYANAAFEQLSGYGFPELAAMDSVYELAVQRSDAERRARRRIDEGVVDPSYTLEMRRRDGAVVQLELAGVPLRIAPGRIQLVVVVRDVTARRRAEDERERLLARSALLAEASALFDQSLDEETTLDSVARLCVRELADTCTVVLSGWRGPARRAIGVARDPAREAAVPHTLDELDAPVWDVLRRGRATIAADEAQVRVIVPLRARERVVGALAAGFDVLPAADRAETLTLLEELGRRAALALDNSRLYTERTAVAQTLQRSLLPPDLPLIPGAQVAARYLAAGSGNEIGGDFYDCFSAGSGDWALVIGDVCGKGPEAAAITALVRYTLRASVLHARRPSVILTELNQALLQQSLDHRFCTVLYASVTPRDDGLEAVLATGGHPLGLVLRADGSVETAGSPGTLLGILREVEISEERVLLRPGDALVLYTDGVVEASPADEALAPERLAVVLGGLAGRDAGAIAEAIERKALEVQDGRLRDDVAVVVLRVRPGGPEPASGAQPGGS
jgi:PAS domain S-box-containing protein